MVLSRDWQLKNVVGILRILANQLSTDETQDLALHDFIHLSILDLAELLGEAGYPDYGEIHTFDTTTMATKNGVAKVMDLTSSSSSVSNDLKIDKITKIVDMNNGLCIEVNSHEFDNLSNIPQKENNIYWFKFGDYIYLYKGSNIAGYGTNIYLYYNRTPTKATSDSDYLDVNDKFVKLVIDKAKILLYEQLNLQAPSSLTNQVNANIQQIRQTNMRELQKVKEFSNQDKQTLNRR